MRGWDQIGIRPVSPVGNRLAAFDEALRQMEVTPMNEIKASARAIDQSGGIGSAGSPIPDNRIAGRARDKKAVQIQQNVHYKPIGDAGHEGDRDSIIDLFGQ